MLIFSLFALRRQLRRQREQVRRERAAKRHEFVLKKADEYARYAKLAAFSEFMRREVYEYSGEPVDRIIGELESLVAVMADAFKRESLDGEMSALQLYTDDDTVEEDSRTLD